MFERSSGGVRLTAAGTEILRTSRHLADGLDHMMASAKAAGRGETGRLAIASTPHCRREVCARA